MDVNDLRVMVTVLSFVAFIGIVVWSLAARRRQGFDEAAQLPFLESPLESPFESPLEGRPAAGVQGEKK